MATRYTDEFRHDAVRFATNGPVMDRLKEQHYLKEMTGKVFLPQFEVTQKAGAT